MESNDKEERKKDYFLTSQSFIEHILTKTQNWVGLTIVNVRANKITLQLHENVVQNYIAIEIPSSAIKNSDRACPVAEVTCLDRICIVL